MSPYRDQTTATRAPRATLARWAWALVRGVFLARWWHRRCPWVWVSRTDGTTLRRLVAFLNIRVERCVFGHPTNGYAIHVRRWRARPQHDETILEAPKHPSERADVSNASRSFDELMAHINCPDGEPSQPRECPDPWCRFHGPR